MRGRGYRSALVTLFISRKSMHKWIFFSPGLRTTTIGADQGPSAGAIHPIRNSFLTSSLTAANVAGVKGLGLI